MKNYSVAMALAAAFCTMALVVGCSSTSASSAASASASTSAASAEATAASETAASEATVSETAPTGAAVDPANLADGEYQIAVTLQGGTGRATVESPAKLNVIGGKMTAVIVWSSKNYDQMIVDGTEYYPVPRPGNSTFEIPVSALDQDVAIQAETTAMSEPHMIDYTLHFDSSTITAA